jgi:hypothetical protein
VPNVTGKIIVVASVRRRERAAREVTHQLRGMGAVVVDVGVDGSVDDMRTLAAELLAQEPRIDVVVHLDTRRDFEGAVVHPYLLTRLLGERVAESRGRVLWSVAAPHRTATFDPDAPPARGRRAARAAAAGHQLARALLVHEWARRDDRIATASFEDRTSLAYLCGSDEQLRGGHFVNAVRVADAPAATDATVATKVWERCATAARLAP